LIKYYFRCICDCDFDIKDSKKRRHFKKGDEFWVYIWFGKFFKNTGQPSYLISKFDPFGYKSERYYMTAEELNKYFEVEVAFS